MACIRSIGSKYLYFNGKLHLAASSEEINSIINPKILDIGCGYGWVSIKLARK
jgi:16S rRNA G1207 methylase RsmC